MVTRTLSHTQAPRRILSRYQDWCRAARCSRAVRYQPDTPNFEHGPIRR